MKAALEIETLKKEMAADAAEDDTDLSFYAVRVEEALGISSCSELMLYTRWSIACLRTASSGPETSRRKASSRGTRTPPAWSGGSLTGGVSWACARTFGRPCGSRPRRREKPTLKSSSQLQDEGRPLQLLPRRNGP